MRFSFDRPLEYYIRSNVFMTFSLNITAEQMQFIAKTAAYFLQNNAKKGSRIRKPLYCHPLLALAAEATVFSFKL